MWEIVFNSSYYGFQALNLLRNMGQEISIWLENLFYLTIACSSHCYHSYTTVLACGKLTRKGK